LWKEREILLRWSINMQLFLVHEWIIRLPAAHLATEIYWFSPFYVVLSHLLFLQLEQPSCLIDRLFCLLHHPLLQDVLVPSLNCTSCLVVQLALQIFVKCDIIGQLQFVIDVAVHQGRASAIPFCLVYELHLLMLVMIWLSSSFLWFTASGSWSSSDSRRWAWPRIPSLLRLSRLRLTLICCWLSNYSSSWTKGTWCITWSLWSEKTSLRSTLRRLLLNHVFCRRCSHDP
jgi:hypothetical protein